MLPYIDIHTHNSSSKDTIFQVVNHIVGSENIPTSICSSGIHPWYIGPDLKDQLLVLASYARRPNVIAIGECGLDKKCNTPWDLQIEAFERQIQLANELNKPLIIHSVRAFEEITKQLKDRNIKVPVFFHGVNKKDNLIQSLINQGYYVGLGTFILRGNHDETIKKIPLDRFFLETDNSPTNIIDIYTYFCHVRNIPIELLIKQLILNVSNVFKYNVVP